MGRTPRPRGGRAARGCRAGARVRRGRGQYHSAAASRDGFSIYFANVSSWNEVVSDYIFNLDSDAVLLAELHLKADKVDSCLCPAGRSGWDTSIGPARQSSLSVAGSNAGVATMVHHRWLSTPWPDSVDCKGRAGPFSDLVGRSVRLDDVEVDLLVAYFDCQAGLEGRNLDLLERVEHRTGAGRSPFYLGRRL